MHSMLRDAAVELMFSTTVLPQEEVGVHLPAVGIGRYQSTPFSKGWEVKYFQLPAPSLLGEQEVRGLMHIQEENRQPEMGSLLPRFL